MATQFPPKKGAAFILNFTLYKNDGTVIANPGTFTKRISKDEGATANISASVTKNDTTYGQCSVALSAAEMNADRVWIYIADNTDGCIPFSCTIYTSGQTLDEIDTAVSTRLAASGYTAPDNAGITAIKTQTDKLAFTGSDVKATLDGEKVTVTVNEDKTGYTASTVSDKTGYALTSAYDAAKTAASQTSVNAIPTNPLLTTDARLNNLDATVSSRSTLTAAQVWANGTRTLSSFGTLVSDIASAVWGAATRTLTAISDSAGITTLLGRIGSALTINSGKVTVGANDDKSGYGLADGAITAAKIAANALNGKGDWNTTTPPTTGQIRSAMEDDGSHLALILEDTSATLPDQLTGMSGTTFDPATDSLEMIRDRGDAAWLTATGFSTLTEAGVRNAVGLASANLDDQLGELPTAPEIKEEMESDGGHLDLILDDTHTTIPAALAAMASSTAAAVWNTLLSTMTTIGSIGKAFADWLPGASVGLPPLVPSVVTICNNAIMLAGNASPIVSISDDTRAAKLCAQFYQQAFDATLRAYTWNCATERSGELAAAPEPEFGFGFAYELPIDCLRVLAVKGDDKIRFKIESGRLLTDASPCKISYIKRIAPDDADILLREAVSARLAATIAFPLTNSTSAAKAMWELYKDKLDEAQAIDAFEGTAPQMASDDWVHSRS